MKLHPDRIDTPNLIAAYTRDTVMVGDQAWRESIVLPWQGEVQAWPAASFEALTRMHFDPIAGLAPDLVLFGSGARLRFARPEWLGSLMAARIGVETMDFAAACRTYNLLVAEGRKVVAALLIEPGASA